MVRYVVVALSFALMLGHFTGCAKEPLPDSYEEVMPAESIGMQSAPPPPSKPVEAVDDSFPKVKRVIASEYLINSISLLDPKIGKKGDFSRVQVSVKNLTQNRYELEYQYQWEDHQGFSVGSPRPWRRFVLGPREFKDLSEMALRKDAEQVILNVRLVDDSPFATPGYQSYQPATNQYNQINTQPNMQ